MTPGARVAAAIEVLDKVLAGAPAEAALTRWARGNRFAGSKDRAAIRDHVFDGLRRLRSASATSGAMTGRGVMLGLLAGQGDELDAIFSGEGYAPSRLSEEEERDLKVSRKLTPAELADLPDEIWPIWQKSLGERSESCARVQQDRAPITLRVNLAKTTRSEASKALLTEGIETRENTLSQSALTVLQGARKVKLSQTYQQGLVELQDAASQAVIDSLGIQPEARVLDYCAGGGGKSLAMAAQGAEVSAFDSNFNRMDDLIIRAERADARVTRVDQDALGTAPRFDLVLCDVPCSGSGTWRRTPDAKWRFTPQALTDLVKLQREICQSALKHMSEQGAFAYVTCSVFQEENQDTADWICDRFGMAEVSRFQHLPDGDGDGLFGALFRRI